MFSTQSEAERFLEYLIIADAMKISAKVEKTTKLCPTERDFLNCSLLVVEFLLSDRICTERELHCVVKDIYEEKRKHYPFFQSSDHIVSEEITAMLFGPKLENREWTKGIPPPEFYVVFDLF